MMCLSMQVYVCVCACIAGLLGSIWNAAAGFNRLFGEREDFPVQGYTPLNRLRSLLAGEGAPHLCGQMEPFNTCADALAGTQGPGEVAGRNHRCQSLRKVGEPNCRRHPPDPMELAAVHNCPLSWLRGVHHSYENLAGSTNERLVFRSSFGGEGDFSWSLTVASFSAFHLPFTLEMTKM